MKKRYNLGVMDIFPVAINKTCMENSPLLKVQFDDEVDAERLYDAVKCALKSSFICLHYCLRQAVLP